MVWWCSTKATLPAPARAASSVIPADRRPQIRGWGEGIGTLRRKSLIPKRDTTSHENVADPITNDLRGYFQGNFLGNHSSLFRDTPSHENIRIPLPTTYVAIFRVTLSRRRPGTCVAIAVSPT